MPTKTTLRSTLLLLISIPALSAETSMRYQPARFPDDESTVLRYIPFPDIEGDIFLRLYCDVNVERSGDFTYNYCWSDHPQVGIFLASLVDNGDSIRIEPAMVDGDKVEVWFQYTVQYEKKDGVKSIKLFPHQFFGIDGDGTGYTGPQRYQVSNTPKGVLNRCTASYSIWYSMMVSEEGGKPEKVVALGEGHDQMCLRYTANLVRNGWYIPAFLDGVPATAPYRELFFNVVRLRSGGML